MATHSCILAWRIPWTQEPWRLQFMGSQRVRCDWATHKHTHTHTHSCSAVSESLWLQRLQPTRLVFDPLPLLHGIVTARTLEWVPFPPLGNLPDPGLNLSLLHSKQILYCWINKVAVICTSEDLDLEGTQKNVFVCLEWAWHMTIFMTC